MENNNILLEAIQINPQVNRELQEKRWVKDLLESHLLNKI